MYNRGVSSCGTFTAKHTNNGWGSFNIADNYLEISTNGQTGAGGWHEANSTENINKIGYKKLNIVYEIMSVNNSHRCVEFRYGCSKKVALGSVTIGTYTNSLDISDITDYQDSKLNLFVRADWTGENITARIYEIYLTNK